MHRVLLAFFTMFFFVAFHPLQGESSCQKWVLVTGGAGFIGSHVNALLHRHGYHTVVLDNLSRGNCKAVQQGVFIEGDVADRELLDRIFTDFSIDAVMHFAAFIEVGESVHNPLKYYINNVSATLNLLEAMRKHHVNTFIFSSSAAVYGSPKECYVDESYPCNPINSYGQTKLMVETILKDLDQAKYGLKYCALRYFNVAGGDPCGEIKNYSTKQANLIPLVLRQLQQPDGSIAIFGTDFPTHDGTAVRDYVHVDDLAAAHISAMEHLFEGKSSAIYNLGTGHGHSAREVINAAQRITGRHLHVIDGPRRPGDPASLVANAGKAKRELGWEAKHSLDQIIADAWRAMQ